MIMNKLLIIATLIFLAISCKKLETEPLGPTDIRIKNLTNKILTELTVETGGGEHNFGLLKVDSVSAYHRYEKAYQKANITAIINGQKYKTDTAIFTYMPYLGQVKATYQIDISANKPYTFDIYLVYDDSLK
jgi:hypothetical protein